MEWTSIIIVMFIPWKRINGRDVWAFRSAKRKHWRVRAKGKWRESSELIRSDHEWPCYVQVKEPLDRSLLFNFFNWGWRCTDPSLSICGRCFGVPRKGFLWNWLKSSFSGWRSHVAPLQKQHNLGEEDDMTVNTLRLDAQLQHRTGRGLLIAGKTPTVLRASTQSINCEVSISCLQTITNSIYSTICPLL